MKITVIDKPIAPKELPDKEWCQEHRGKVFLIWTPMKVQQGKASYDGHILAQVAREKWDLISLEDGNRHYGHYGGLSPEELRGHMKKYSWRQMGGKILELILAPLEEE